MKVFFFALITTTFAVECLKSIKTFRTPRRFYEDMIMKTKISNLQELIEVIKTTNEFNPNTTLYSQLEYHFANRIGHKIQKLVRSHYAHDRSTSLTAAALGSVLGVCSSSVFGETTPFNKNEAIQLLLDEIQDCFI